MTKNYEKSEKMAPSKPQSPEDQVMEFINNLGDQMEEVFSRAPSPQTEKGDQSASEKEARAQENPPDYDQAEQTGESSAHANRSGNGGGDRRDRPQWGGPWGGNWRGHPNPWVQMASSLAENFTGPNANGPPPPHPGMFFGGGGPGGFGGPGGCRGGRGGFGGFGGGRGSYHGPWGWGSHRSRWGNRGSHCHRPDNGSQEFTPAVDLFDTPDSFVIHVALTGAIKEDIGINYDFDNAELQVSGVVHRPGNEEFQKHLVDGERRVGAFDRKIKLESNGKTVPVDADGITAKLENGLLEVTVPKLRKADEPEKKKIIIE
ncbi:uncharacterized protein DFL_001674 [Arthrobotrys flagrans]|uniref:SHSP domain-containing protein n=1 Tax=Arthrobotrys flagrans TaxID=97331 RepID=A0A437A899_ARTFL|nr:hypothetical protein DFL_001674 [Arthrobotrys flagrans]